MGEQHVKLISLPVAPSKDGIWFLIPLFINIVVHRGPGVHNLEKIRSLAEADTHITWLTQLLPLIHTLPQG